MTVCYRDELGEVAVTIDKDGVGFCDGIAYFWSDGKEYNIPINQLIAII